VVLVLVDAAPVRVRATYLLLGSMLQLNE